MSNERLSHFSGPQLENLEDRFCMSASPMLVAEVAPPEPKEALVRSTSESTSSVEAQGLDVVVAATTTDVADGGEGNDLLIGGDGIDVLRGGAGNDTLLGNRGNDIVLGQDANDLLIVNNGDGSDFLEGGEGNDFVQVNGANGAGDTRPATEVNDLVFEIDADPTITLEYIVLM